jgi:hypothetical protein
MGMAFEKRLAELPPQFLTADGSADGRILIADAYLLKVKQIIYLRSSTAGPLQLEVKRVLDKNTALLGPPGSNIDSRADLSAFTLTDQANVFSIVKISAAPTSTPTTS